MMIEKIFAAIDLFAKYVGKTVVLTIRQSKGTMANGLILTQYSYDAAGTRQSVSHSVPVVTGSVPSGSELPPALQLQTTRRDYVGSCILQYYQLERILIPGGYIDADGKYYFYHTDYQGNNRAVVDAEGYVAQRTDYYPYGLPMRQKSADAQPYKYSGKEFDPINGLNTYDFHARAYNPAAIFWQRPDPIDYLDESVSPWVFCRANPIMYYDFSGQKAILKGDSKKETLEELQKAVGESLVLSIDDNGNLSYKEKMPDALSKEAERVKEIIDDESIDVHFHGNDTDYTSTGYALFGGAFMGNYYDKDDNTVTTRQEINPHVLKKMSDANGKPGADTLHEFTESYEGGKEALKKKKSHGPATTNDKAYRRAHNKATPQSGPIEKVCLDNNGNRVNDIENAKTVLIKTVGEDPINLLRYDI